MSENQTKGKVSLVGLIMLIIAFLVFSGIFADAEGPLEVVDFTNLLGSFGKIAETFDFRGKGGVSARDGFLFSLTLCPNVMVAMGLIQIFENYGPDSFLGRLASIIQGSTDTTFYVITLYFGVIGIKKIRYALWAGLFADLAGILASLFLVGILFH